MKFEELRTIIARTIEAPDKKEGGTGFNIYVWCLASSQKLSGNTLQDVIHAAKIKARYPMSYADCFAVATAIKEKAAIITGDPDFKHIEKIVSVEWLETSL